MKTRKTKKSNKQVTFKRMAAGMLAGVMLLGNTGTALAANADSLRAEGQAAVEAGDYEIAREIYGEILQMNEAGVADFWNAGRIEHALGFYYSANEMQDKAFEMMNEAGDPTAIYEQKIKSMYAAGKYWLVEKYYKEAVEKGIANAFMAAHYGDALANCKQNKKAIEVYEKGIEAYSEDNDGYIAAYLYDIGDCYKIMGKTEEAAVTYEEALYYGGDTAKYNSKMTALELEYKLNNVDNVVALYLGDKTNEEIADTLSKYECYDEALQYYEKAENEDGTDMRSSKAKTYYRMGLPKEAAALYEEFILENPDDIDAMNMLGGIYCDELGRYDEAKELFEKIVEINPKANATKGNLAVVARKSGKLDEVPGIYHEAIGMNEAYIYAYNYEIKYQKDITVDDAIEVLKGYPGWPKTTEMQALMLAETIEVDFMTETTLSSYLDYFKERLSEDGGNYYYMQTVASILCALGKYEEALSYYEQALEVAGILTYYANNGLGNCYYYNQDYEMAAKYFGANADAEYSKGSRLDVAECHIAAGQFDQAREAIDQYLAEGGTTDDVSDKYMLIAYQEEDYEGLLTYAEKCLEQTPDSLKAKAYKAAALTALGQEGADTVIEDIDSIRYTYEDKDVLIAESILGRLDKAKEIYQFLLENYPKTAREAVYDYELRNLRYDPEFCEMAGLEAPVAKEATEQENLGEVTEGNAAENSEETGVQADGNPIPVVAGVGIVAVLIGIVAVLVKRRESTK